MNDASKTVLEHLVLEQTQNGSFSTVNKNEGWQQVFGGQLMAQAINAATNTVSPEKKLVSFHSLFSSPGDTATRIGYNVANIREGNSFSMRQVTANQNDQTIFHTNASFQVDEKGMDFQVRMPDAPAPSECADLREIVSAYQEYYPDHLREIDVAEPLPPQPIAMRFANIDQLLRSSTNAIDQIIWIKLDAEIGGDQERHKQVLAYASDQTISHMVAQPHGLGGLNPKLRLVSLDHAMWFHNSFCMNDWLLLVRRCQSTTSGRALVTGEVFDGNGKLVASLAQQALVRLED